MEKSSKNGVDLIRLSANKLKGKWGKAFLATLMYLVPLVLLASIPYAGWAIAIAVFGYTTLGYINYMQKLMKGENPSFKVLFVQQEFLQAIMIGVIMAVGTIVGTVLFIIPGILMIGFYSLSLFVLNEDKIENVSDTLNVTARKMNGNKTAMFAYKTIFYFMYAILIAATVLVALSIVSLFTTKAVLAVMLGILSVIVLLVLSAIVTMYFYAANVLFYDEIIRPVKITGYELISGKSKAEVKEVKNAKEDDVEVVVVEEQSVEPKKKSASTAKKTTAKTTAAKKSTTSKTAATKTTTKKATPAKTEDKK